MRNPFKDWKITPPKWIPRIEAEGKHYVRVYSNGITSEEKLLISFPFNTRAERRAFKKAAKASSSKYILRDGQFESNGDYYG